MYPPAVTSDSVVHLELREHLRINPDAERVELLTGIARDLHHIHDLQVTHGRLEFGTVEADRDGTVRISDFWRSPVLPSQVTGSTTNTHPSFIQSASESGPSRTSRAKVAKANDMCAFCLLAWELFAGEFPLRSTGEAMIVVDVAPTQLPRPNYPELSDEVWDMIGKCLGADPDRRLTASSVEIILEVEPVFNVYAVFTETFCDLRGRPAGGNTSIPTLFEKRSPNIVGESGVGMAGNQTDPTRETLPHQLGSIFGKYGVLGDVQDNPIDTDAEDAQPTTSVSVPALLIQPFHFDQNMGMSDSYPQTMEYPSFFPNQTYTNWGTHSIPLDTSFPAMGASPTRLADSSSSPLQVNLDLQTSPTSTNNVQVTVWDLARAYPTARGIPVPQKMYKSPTQSDRRRYVEGVELGPPIMFYLQGPGECGIPLHDALSGKYTRLVGRDDPIPFGERGPSICIRLKWPGYGNWSRRIPTKDFMSPPRPITHSKLAKNTARTVQTFIRSKSETTMDPDVDPRWQVGPGHITIDDLVLVGLQHVSKGSWQCHLRLNRSL